MFQMRLICSSIGNKVTKINDKVMYEKLNIAIRNIFFAE
jgi:hypothetical protein